MFSLAVSWMAATCPDLVLNLKETTQATHTVRNSIFLSFFLIFFWAFHFVFLFENFTRIYFSAACRGMGHFQVKRLHSECRTATLLGCNVQPYAAKVLKIALPWALHVACSI